MICKCCYLLRHIPRQMVTSVSSTGAASRPPCHMLCFRNTQFQPIFEQAVTAFHSVLERHELRSPCPGSATQGETKKGHRRGWRSSEAPGIAGTPLTSPFGVPMPPRGRQNHRTIISTAGQLSAHKMAQTWADHGPQRGSLLGSLRPTEWLTLGPILAHHAAHSWP